jgi:hypothetical protein
MKTGQHNTIFSFLTKLQATLKKKFIVQNKLNFEWDEANIWFGKWMKTHAK